MGRHDASNHDEHLSDDGNAGIDSAVHSERDGHLVPDQDEYGYRIHERPYGTKRRVKIALMGAGLSALSFLKQSEEHLENVDIVVYEKNHDVGGTWLENRYPGCACDVPAVNYQFSWAIQTWTRFYAYSPEIWQYIRGLYDKYDLISRYVRLRHQVERAVWDETKGKWVLGIRDLTGGKDFEDEADFFINAGGVLNDFRWPDVPGIHDFKGKLMHSAAYEPSYDLTNKKVAVIGAGSSGVQIVANIQPKVKELYHWVRSPIWITPGFGQTWAGQDGANFEYTAEQTKYLEENPKKYLEYRKQIENELNQRFKFIIKGSDEAERTRNFAREQMTRTLRQDPRLCENIIPREFNVGCRRPTPAPGYLEALVAENATIFTDSIGRLTERGFLDQEGQEHDVDVVICATGFNTSWLPRFRFEARGKDIRDIWNDDDGVTSYLAIAVPGFPNHFSFCGPYGPVGHGSFVPLIEHWTKYMFEMITKAQEENIKAVAPKWSASRQFRQHADLFLKRTAWTSSCSSWFKQGKRDGQAALYPGSRLHFFHLLDRPRYEDYEYEYWDDNMFSFLGNGFDTREFDGRDITNYLGIMDEAGRDVQPAYDEDLQNRLAGWAVGK